MKKFYLQNRRYVGSKSKLSDAIVEIILKDCTGKTFFDVFAGTAIISKKILPHVDKVIINDFLYSNEVIYKAFFDSNNVDNIKLANIADTFNEDMEFTEKSSNYVVKSFGGKYFSNQDAYKIGEIRENIEKMLLKQEVTDEEYNVLLASLVYSIDKIANTVGHYDAYRKIKNIKSLFAFQLINPLNTKNKIIDIHRRDSNKLVHEIKNVDIAFVDPPYNSRQYSRFYHVLENIVKWDKPTLFGVARKPKPENMSDYSKSVALLAFTELIETLDAKYIVVTYNNTYNPKSSSSRNKIEIEELEHVLNKRGKMKKYNFEHDYFNSGKTEFQDHQEYVYVVEVE